MRNPLKSENSASIGLLLARLPIAAFFLIAGIQKLHGGVENFVAFASRSGHVPSAVSSQWVDTYLHAIPYLELSVGVLLVLGLLSRLVSLIGALMVISFTIGYTGLHGASASDQQLPFHPNLIYAGLLLGLFFVGPGRISLDGLFFGKRRRQAAPLAP